MRRRRRNGGERAFALPWLALCLVVLMAMAGFGVDVWQWYYTAQRTQRAADAAALAGAVYLPGDFARARTTALDAGRANGYAAAALDVGTGASDAELAVDVEQTVRNNFLGLLGIEQTTITRSATAEYQGPVPMGSPVNQLGNDPFGDQGDATVAPRFWLNVAAPNATTQSGDRHQARNCGSAADNCSGGTNVDYQPDGYFLVVDVRSVGGGPLRFQAYDPGFFYVGDACSENLFPAGDARLATLAGPPYGITDAAQRYVRGNTRFCTGDQDIGGRGIDTTFIVRSPDDTPFTNLDNPVLCTRRFEDRNGTVDDLYSRLTSNAETSPEGLRFRDYFRQWVDLCTDTSPEAGQYVIQIRTNANAAAPTAYDQAIGTGGHNRFSLRAGFGSSPAPAAVSTAGVGMFANGRLPIYVNQNDGTRTTDFYLARIAPLNANRTLELNFFDIGDVTNGNVRMTIVPPDEATEDHDDDPSTPARALDTFGGCQFTRRGSSTSAMPACSRGGMSSADFQGKVVRVTIPIPDGYDCEQEDFEGGCWIRVRMEFSANAVPQDTTTWSANMLGDPVRLVE